MGNAVRIKEKSVQAQQEKIPPSDKELLIEIVRQQARLNSKLFEFLRAYQQRHNWGESGMFTEGHGGATRVKRLLDEVNELGATLGMVTSQFIGEEVYEKRDDQGRLLLHCNYCKKETPFALVYDSPYGLSGAYMGGSERLVCAVCKEDTVYPDDERLPKFNSAFRME